MSSLSPAPLAVGRFSTSPNMRSSSSIPVRTTGRKKLSSATRFRQAAANRMVEPTGYPNTGEIWTNTAGVLGRINFATALSGGQVPGVKADMSRFNFKDPTAVASELLSAPPSPQTLSAIDKGIQDKEATP